MLTVKRRRFSIIQCTVIAPSWSMTLDMGPTTCTKYIMPCGETWFVLGIDFFFYVRYRLFLLFKFFEV